MCAKRGEKRKARRRPQTKGDSPHRDPICRLVSQARQSTQEGGKGGIQVAIVWMRVFLAASRRNSFGNDIPRKAKSAAAIAVEALQRCKGRGAPDRHIACRQNRANCVAIIHSFIPLDLLFLTLPNPIGVILVASPHNQTRPRFSRCHPKRRAGSKCCWRGWPPCGQRLIYTRAPAPYRNTP